MAKKKAAKTRAKEPGKVVCFVFYGSIEDLGLELAKMADDSEVISAAIAHVQAAVTPAK